MERHNTALVCSDRDDSRADHRISTADFGYLRLRRETYGDGDLESWCGVVRQQGWRDAFIFFKHEDEADGPRLAKRLLELW